MKCHICKKDTPGDMHLLGSYETKTGKKYRMVHKSCTRERMRNYLARKSVIKKIAVYETAEEETEYKNPYL